MGFDPRAGFIKRSTALVVTIKDTQQGSVFISGQSPVAYSAEPVVARLGGGSTAGVEGSCAHWLLGREPVC